MAHSYSHLHHYLTSACMLPSWLHVCLTTKTSTLIQLAGHEILSVLCGLVWGFWPGFALTAAGTFLGEIGNYWYVTTLVFSGAR